MRARPLLLILLLAFHVPLAAQERPGLAPFVGVSVGTTRLPGALVSLSIAESQGKTLPTLAGHVGLAHGGWMLSLHGSAFTELIVADQTPPVPLDPTSSGVRRFRHHQAYSGSDERELSLRLGFGPTSSFWSVSGGAGRLLDARAPFGLAKVGVHSRGRVRVRAEAERWVIRVPYEDAEIEWKNGGMMLRTSLGSGHAWYPALALRLGVELR